MKETIKSLKPIAFQGEHGAFSEIAVFELFGKSVKAEPTKSFSDVFDKVKKGICEYGVVPVENSLGGIVYQVWDCLNKYNLKIIAETEIKIDHCLIVNPGTKITDIQKIYAHYQPALQCAHFLKSHPGWIVEDTYDTAGSVKIIKNIKSREKGSVAAIASERASEIFGMEILKKGIQDSQQNYTRFIVIRRDKKETIGNKFTFILSLENKPNALLEILKITKTYKVNLTSIHSRPKKDKPFTYLFFMEGVLIDKNPKIYDRFISEIKSKSKTFKLLGTYNSHMK